MHIKVFTTGGTIDKVYFDAQSEYEVGESQVHTLFQEMRVGFTYTVEAIMRKDSLDLTDEDRANIVAQVSAEPCAHILITHGTDTMVATARRLKQIPGKTIVLTGAMQPALFRTSDAIFNIGCAIGALNTLPPGVYIVMNGVVFDPEHVRKNRASGRFEQTDENI